MQIVKLIPAFFLVACSSAWVTAASEKGPDSITSPKSERCLSLTRIRDMHILDNQRIVFELANNENYLNTLPYPCPGMRKNSTIMYRTSLSELCDVDIITLLDQVGSGYMPGASCGLGKFIPISKEELDLLKAVRQ